MLVMAFHRCLFFVLQLIGFSLCYKARSKIFTFLDKRIFSKFQSRTQLFSNVAVPLQSNIPEILPLTSEPPLKILLCVEPTPFNYISGYANRYKEMLDHLKTAGDDIKIITSDNSNDAPNQYNGYPILNLKGMPLLYYKAIRISFDIRGKIKEVIKQFKPDIIHCSSPSFLIFGSLIWSKIFNIPIILTYHTHVVEYTRSYEKFPGSVWFVESVVRMCHKNGDLTLCTSPQLVDVMKELGIAEVDLWPKGVNTKVFNPSFRSEAMRSKLSKGHIEAPLLIYIGRLGVEKRLYRLKAVLDAIPGSRLAIIGKGPAEDELKEHFRGYPVHFAGTMTGEPLSQAFASADIFVMPSDSETLGFVAIEAMASGIPVVGVNAGGLPDIIQHGVTGYLAENNDNMIEFINYTKKIIADKELCKSLGSSSRKLAESWSWEAATSKLRNVFYRKAIALRKAKQNRMIEVNRDVFDIYRPDLAF